MDLFLEQRVRDLSARAQQQLASGLYEAARATWRTALDDVEGALAFDPSNPTAAGLRRELIEAMAQVPASAGAHPEAVMAEHGGGSWSAARGGNLPGSEVLSILDPTPRPEEPDYWKGVAVLLVALELAIAIVVISYYGTRHRHMDNTPLEQRAKYAALPAPTPAIAQPENDDTIYWTEPGLTLPLLLHKSEPEANAQGTVVLAAVIDPTGTPINMQVRRGLTPDLNVQAIRAVEKWRFRPGRKDGKPVPVVVTLEVSFRRP